MSSGAIVGFDTATPAMSVAATRGDDVLLERLSLPAAGERPAHARELLGAVEEAAGAAGGWDAVEAIAVGIGPGSFTGLRIGVATARGLAQGLEKPIAPVGSLAALSRGVGERGARDARPHLAVIDARRGQVFAALYEPDGEVLWPPLVAAPAELGERLAELPSPPVAAGDGSVRFRHELEAAGAEVLADGDERHLIRAREICALAGEGGRSEPAEVEPIYLRPPDAELWHEQQRRDRERRP
jgi:tRNA threonylcarbamoyladenosine biosynthesis protein TsaB